MILNGVMTPTHAISAVAELLVIRLYKRFYFYQVTFVALLTFFVSNINMLNRL